MVNKDVYKPYSKRPRLKDRRNSGTTGAQPNRSSHYHSCNHKLQIVTASTSSSSSSSSSSN